MTLSKHLNSPHYHIKEKSLVKAYIWPMCLVYAGEYCIYNVRQWFIFSH